MGVRCNNSVFQKQNELLLDWSSDLAGSPNVDSDVSTLGALQSGSHFSIVKYLMGSTRHFTITYVGLNFALTCRYVAMHIASSDASVKM